MTTFSRIEKHYQMAFKFFLFLILNFGALALGGLFTGSGVTSDWYANLNQAPWTPPGWVFGAAWTSIMICFTFYMTIAYQKAENKQVLIILFILQWILNVSWNPIFFYFHQIILGLIVIASLTILIAFILGKYKSQMKLNSLWLLPYFIWLIIATSLNAYIFFHPN